MLSLPSRFAAVILAFAPVFLQQRTWRHAEVLLIGAVLAPGQRTVASILRITGLARERRFVNYHRILNRVRSSHGYFVKASGLRWLSLMLLVPVPWAGRVWALPFLTTLAPSERYCREHGRRHKKLTDWARQLALQARRWLPGREVVLLGDSSFAALDLLATLVRHGVTCVTRLRLDAALYGPAPPRRPGAVGRPRTKGSRLPTFRGV